MSKVITISREYGAGGTTIGKAVANKLGIEFLDKALILTTAYEAQVDIKSVFKLDEMAPSAGKFSKGILDFYNRPLNDKLFEAQSEVIKLFAERGDCVIVGRNANSIIRNHENTLHVFLSGSLPYRREMMMKKEMYQGVSEAKMTELINTVDKRRAKYCDYYTDTTFGDARNYDLCLDVSRLGIDKCIDIICDLARD